MGLFRRKPAKRVAAPLNRTAHEADLASDEAARDYDAEWARHIEGRLVELESEVEYLTRGKWRAEHEADRDEEGRR